MRDILQQPDDVIALVQTEKLRAMLTDLGRQFIQACVIDKNIQPRA